MPTTGRTTAELLPRFETVTYRERRRTRPGGHQRVGRDPVRPGDRVALLGFTSVDYTSVDIALIGLGAVSVPLQTSAPVAQLRPIIAETGTDPSSPRASTISATPSSWSSPASRRLA